jgi:hypothetical protein
MIYLGVQAQTASSASIFSILGDIMGKTAQDSGSNTGAIGVLSVRRAVMADRNDRLGSLVKFLNTVEMSMPNPTRVGNDVGWRSTPTIYPPKRWRTRPNTSPTNPQLRRQSLRS